MYECYEYVIHICNQQNKSVVTHIGDVAVC